MSKWSRDMACALRLSWRRWVRDAEHVVPLSSAWWGRRATPLPCEFSQLVQATLSQGINLLNFPTCSLSLTHTQLPNRHTCTHIPSGQLTQNKWPDPDQLLNNCDWMKDSDRCFVFHTEKKCNWCWAFVSYLDAKIGACIYTRQLVPWAGCGLSSHFIWPTKYYIINKLNTIQQSHPNHKQHGIRYWYESSK